MEEDKDDPDTINREGSMVLNRLSKNSKIQGIYPLGFQKMA